MKPLHAESCFSLQCLGPASLCLPTAMLLMASDAEAQQADQAAPPETAPKRKRRRRCAFGTTESPVIALWSLKLCAASRPAGI